MTTRVPQCVFCVHYHPGRGSCEAFPGGIPTPIKFNQIDHRVPYSGDRGVRFTAIEGEEHPLEVAKRERKAAGLPDKPKKPYKPTHRDLPWSALTGGGKK